MNRTITIPLAVMLSLAAPAIASADVIADRQDRQAQRIEQGRNNGSITWTEGLKLRAEQNRIARTRAAMEAKGYLTRSDRAKLAQMQNAASKNIRAESRDGWHRLGGLPRVGTSRWAGLTRPALFCPPHGLNMNGSCRNRSKPVQAPSIMVGLEPGTKDRCPQGRHHAKGDPR